MKKRTIYRYVGENPMEAHIGSQIIRLVPGRFISKVAFAALPSGLTIEQEIRA